MTAKKRKHEDTSISLHPLTVEEALKKAMEAGPLPKKKAGDTTTSASRHRHQT